MTKVVGYTFHADIYCRDCAEKFPQIDSEGNPKHPVFSTDELGYIDDSDAFIPYFCVECFLESSEWE